MKRNYIVESDEDNVMHFINNKHAVQSCMKDTKYCANAMEAESEFRHMILTRDKEDDGFFMVE